MAVVESQVVHPNNRHCAVGDEKYDASTSAHNGSVVHLPSILAQLLHSPLDFAQEAW
jgi:hypothetical protein